ncbi:Protein PAL1 [Ceratocystis platani]|uniref:Protein PAL1 n=1 Tax=Ceratocystis fimbriata f. sp. platani TaxID=88771 RepID=A0A0F8B4Z6_CERFI|nr:Protein PAL1 [Ceratocystis platani]
MAARPESKLVSDTTVDEIFVYRERPLTEEEKVLREARRLARMNTQKTKETGKKPNKRMDIIDQLDASSIFGMGIVHHDGPYDALNAHRNRGSSRRAPMRAFPKNSLNNSMGGSGPLNARPDHQTFMGNNDSDAFNDYSVAAPKADVPDGVFDPTSRGHIIHGDESLGLGSSTFLEGTPAARTIIQQKQAEDAEQIAVEGLKRQKSLAHRLRSVRRPNRNYPDGFKGATRKPSDAIPLPSRAGGMGENTPFIPEYDAEPESLTVRGKGGSSSPPQFRGRTMSDDVTSSNATSGGGGGGGGGILSRVKSLKGGRRNRSQTENYDPSMPMPNTTSHGTADRHGCDSTSKAWLAAEEEEDMGVMPLTLGLTLALGAVPVPVPVLVATVVELVPALTVPVLVHE